MKEVSNVAVITGASGMDGSHLIDHMLARGDWRIFALVRRHGSGGFPTRLKHLRDEERLHFVYGDVTDPVTVDQLVGTACSTAMREGVSPKDIAVFNLAANSFVGNSWDCPDEHLRINAGGFLNVVRAVKNYSPKSFVYQASTSEMFGDAPPPQNEETRLHPLSPYAIAKVTAHHIAQCYRQRGMSIWCGILFNHECVDARTPLVVRIDGAVDVVYPEELLPLRRKGPSSQTHDLCGVRVWDGERWSVLTCITATRRRETDGDHRMLSTEARAGVVVTTAHHRMLQACKEAVRADAQKEGDDVLLGSFPELLTTVDISLDFAELLGHLTAEGHIAKHGVRYTNNDEKLLTRVESLWRSVFLGASSRSSGISGFTGEETGITNLHGCGAVIPWLRSLLYSKYGEKRVPRIILNASDAAKRRYFDGYYTGDGLKAGAGRSFKTSSPLLAQGLNLLCASFGHSVSVYQELRCDARYYQVNMSSLEYPTKGEHLKKRPEEIRRITPTASSGDWVFDLETSSGQFMAGVGRVVVHNSPRRGLEFVTQRIAFHIARVARGIGPTYFCLGDTSSQRDWGCAIKYTDIMLRVFDLHKTGAAATDLVVGSGQTHTVQAFLEECFKIALDRRTMPPLDVIVRRRDSRKRPNDVRVLQADITKLRGLIRCFIPSSAAALRSIAEPMVSHWLTVQGNEIAEALLESPVE